MFNDYIGGDYYTIRFVNGTHELTLWSYEDTSECVFRGHYNKCLDEFERLRIGYLESLY